MRNLFRKLKQENLNLIASEEVRSDKIGSADDQLKRRQTNNYGSLESDKYENKGEGVGDLLKEDGFGLGMAPREAKPVTKIEMSKEKEEEIARMQQF